MTSVKGSAPGELEGTIELLWGLREPPSRGPKPTLSVARIARTAIDIADTEGIPAVSMQRVAGELDFTKMALYRYVTGKAALVAVMIEAAVGPPPDLSGAGDWRAGLEEWTRLMWATWERHPWLPEVTIGNRVMGPNELGWVESAISTLDRTGLAGAERISAVQLLGGHIRNARLAGAGTAPWSVPDTPPRNGTGELSPSVAELLRRHGDRYPALTAAFTSAPPVPPAAPAPPGAPRDSVREFGLGRILDGLAALIAERSAAH